MFANALDKMRFNVFYLLLVDLFVYDALLFLLQKVLEI
jgi:hypothetical protein